MFFFKKHAHFDSGDLAHTRHIKCYSILNKTHTLWKGGGGSPDITLPFLHLISIQVLVACEPEFSSHGPLILFLLLLLLLSIHPKSSSHPSSMRNSKCHICFLWRKHTRTDDKYAHCATKKIRKTTCFEERNGKILM